MRIASIRDDMKESIKEDEEDEEEEEEVVQYEPFVEGETLLRRTEFIDRRRDYGHLIENQEEYDFLLKNGVDAFIEKYVGDFGIDALTNDTGEVRKEEYSLGKWF